MRKRKERRRWRRGRRELKGEDEEEWRKERRGTGVSAAEGDQ